MSRWTDARWTDARPAPPLSPQALDSRVIDNQWLCGTDGPCAPDFTLYGVMQHLISYSGDAELAPCFPDLLDVAAAPHLRNWFERMSERFPIDFGGRALHGAERVRIEKTW